MDQAMVGINELLGKVDSLLIIPNDRLKFATDQKVTLANAFEIADDVLRQAVVSISDLIKNTGFINLDFADVTCVMKDAGFAHMGVGRAAGKGKAEDAARMAVASPLMETSINGARGVQMCIRDRQQPVADRHPVRGRRHGRTPPGGRGQPGAAALHRRSARCA